MSLTTRHLIVRRDSSEMPRLTEAFRLAYDEDESYVLRCFRAIGFPCFRNESAAYGSERRKARYVRFFRGISGRRIAEGTLCPVRIRFTVPAEPNKGGEKANVDEFEYDA